MVVSMGNVPNVVEAIPYPTMIGVKHINVN